MVLFSTSLTVRCVIVKYSDHFQQQLATRIRDFETDLLRWIQDESDTEALTRLEQTLLFLSAMERRESFRKLWWLGSGMAEAMRYGTIDSTQFVKHLFACILHELRCLRNHDGAIRRDTPSSEVLDDILVALRAPVTPTMGPIMRNLAREFDLHPGT
jgi:hypothetical protein